MRPHPGDIGNSFDCPEPGFKVDLPDHPVAPGINSGQCLVMNDDARRPAAAAVRTSIARRTAAATVHLRRDRPAVLRPASRYSAVHLNQSSVAPVSGEIGIPTVA